MNLVIAEKPSVARSIATVIGATEKQTGYWQGGGYLVSWCIGHLVSFAEEVLRALLNRPDVDSVTAATDAG